MVFVPSQFLSVAFIPCRSTLHKASTQPCYLLPTLSPGCCPGARVSRVPPRTRQPAAPDGPGPPPALGAPSAPHCPASYPSVPGCPGASLPTSGLTPAIPHPAAASGSAAPQDPPTLQVKLGLQTRGGMRHTQTYSRALTQTYTRAHAHILSCTHTYSNIYTCSHTHTHTDTHMLICSLFPHTITPTDFVSLSLRKSESHTMHFFHVNIC